MKTWSGIYTALITPFKNDRLDEDGLHLLLQRQREAGVDGIVLLGTTGEAPTLTPVEKQRILEIASDEMGELRCIVGTGSNSTPGTIAATEWAAKQGAEAALVIAPYYNQPSQAGLIAHFQLVAAESPIPVILYNHPRRTGVTLEPETVRELMAHPNIVALKEAGGNLALASEGFPVLSGDDLLTLPMMAVGGQGVFSVISNLVPKEVKAMVYAAQEGDFFKAREIHCQLLPLMRTASLQTNPVPIKAMMEAEGLPAGNPRLPLLPMELEVPCASVC